MLATNNRSYYILALIPRICLISLIIILNGCEQQSDTKNNTIFTNDLCKSFRKNPNQLKKLLKCMVKHDESYTSMPGTLGNTKNVCEYLPVAIKLLQSGALDSKEYDFLDSDMLDSLPIKDFVNAWAPALKFAYIKKYITKKQFITAVFPANREDVFLAYSDADVRRFYKSLLNEKSIASLEIRIYRDFDTAEKLARAILSGSLASDINKAVEQGKIHDNPRPVDTIITCAKITSLKH